MTTASRQDPSGRTPKSESGAMTDELKHLRKENREAKKWLEAMVKAIDQAVRALDDEMKKPSTVERGKRVAAICNFLEDAKDRCRFFSPLDIDFRTGKKKRKPA